MREVLASCKEISEYMLLIGTSAAYATAGYRLSPSSAGVLMLLRCGATHTLLRDHRPMPPAKRRVLCGKCSGIHVVIAMDGPHGFVT